VLWTTPFVYTSHFTVSLVENNILYSGNLYGASAVDAKTGKVLWKRDFGAGGFSIYGVGNTALNNVVLSDSLLFQIGYKGASDHAWLHVINKATGNMVWEKDLSSGFISVSPFYATPVVSGDKVFAVANDEQRNGKVYCFDKLTGAKIWENNGFFKLDGYPIVYKDNLFIGNGNNLLNLNTSNGSLKWSANTPYRSNGVKPVVIDDRTVHFFARNFNVTGDYKSLLINIADGSTKATDNKLYESLTYDSSHLYYYDLRKMIAVNPLTQQNLWQWNDLVGANYFSLPPSTAILNNSPLVATKESILLYQYFFKTGDASATRNKLYVIDKATGQLSKEVAVSTGVRFKNFTLVQGESVYYPYN